MKYQIVVNHTADNGSSIIETDIANKPLARELLRGYTRDWNYAGDVFTGKDHVTCFGTGWASIMYIEIVSE